MSDVCWVHCFFDTVLGPGAVNATVNYTKPGPDKGLTVFELDEAWDRPFATEDPALGGCPNIEDFADPPSDGSAWSSLLTFCLILPLVAVALFGIFRVCTTRRTRIDKLATHDLAQDLLAAGFEK